MPVPHSVVRAFVPCLALLCWQASAFATFECGGRAHQSALNLRLRESHGDDRRTFLVERMPAALLSASGAASGLSVVRPAPAYALLMDKSTPDVPAFNGGASEARDRFRLAMRDVDALLADYDSISKSGGDNVRLYLGTQGVKSHMYGISKVLQLLKEEANDIVEYTETLNEFEAYYYQAEGAAYQSMFAEHSSARSTPESLLRTAREDIVNMRRYMGDLAAQLNVGA